MKIKNRIRLWAYKMKVKLCPHKQTYTSYQAGLEIRYCLRCGEVLEVEEVYV